VSPIAILDAMAPLIRPARDPADLAAAHEVRAASLEHDIPGFGPQNLADLEAAVRNPWPDYDVNWLVAEVAGRLVGRLDFALPTRDNTHLAQVDLWVHPSARRRGVGRALFVEAARLAAEAGRTTLIGEYATTHPGGAPRDHAPAGFAAAMGAKPALVSTRRELDLAALPDLEALRRAALPHAVGYTSMCWSGPVPAEYEEGVARLESRLIADAPMGDLDLEPEKVDAARVRASGEVRQRRGGATYHCVMCDDTTGQPVAWTMVGTDIGPTTHAWQAITIVDPDHRGHRLGLLVKIANLEQLRARDPHVRYLTTYNAAENAKMIAINETLGFRIVDDWVDWQFIL
jgi:GNAT superfamily N-acetyltransferase